MKRRNQAYSLILIALIGTLSNQILAASTSATIQVTASVNPTCSFAVTNIAFGAITPAPSGSSLSTGTVTSTCNKSVPYSITISSGNGSVDNIYTRSMTAGTQDNTDKLLYNIYTTNVYSFSTVWGDGNSGSTVDLIGTGAAQSTTLYGRVPLNQFVHPDNYSDDLSVVLTY